MVIELSGVQFWSEIIRVILKSNTSTLYYTHLEIILSLFIAKIRITVSTNILLSQLGTKVAKFAIQWFFLCLSFSRNLIGFSVPF